MSDAGDSTTRPPPPIHETTELAVVRSKAALDRTLLAWIRTAFALEGFGFSLATYVSRWIQSGAIHGVSHDAPRRLGITLVTAGVLGLVGGTVATGARHAGSVRRATRPPGPPRFRSPF